MTDLGGPWVMAWLILGAFAAAVLLAVWWFHNGDGDD